MVSTCFLDTKKLGLARQKFSVQVEDSVTEPQSSVNTPTQRVEWKNRGKFWWEFLYLYENPMRKERKSEKVNFLTFQFCLYHASQVFFLNRWWRFKVLTGFSYINSHQKLKLKTYFLTKATKYHHYVRVETLKYLISDYHPIHKN